MKLKLIQTKDYLFLIDKESNIETGNYLLEKESVINIFPDYLTDIDECDKIIAYYPIIKYAQELDLPLLPNPFENNVDVEKLADVFSTSDKVHPADSYISKVSYIEGYRATQSKQFSLEDVRRAYGTGYGRGISEKSGVQPYLSEEDFIQSLSTQQLPKEFIPEYEYHHDDSVPFPKTKTGTATIKTITNSEDKEELVGTYKY